MTTEREILLDQMVVISQEIYGCDFYPRLDSVLEQALLHDECWLPSHIKAYLVFLVAKAGGWWYWNNGLHFRNLDASEMYSLRKRNCR